MNLATFFSQLDANLIAISGIFMGVWLTIHFSLFEAVGNLTTIRDRSICELAKLQKDTELIPFINTLRQKSYVLVLEPKRKSKNLKNFLWLFAFSAALAICYKPIATLIPLWPKDDYFYFFYIFSLGAASVYLWIETKYFREFRRLEREFPSSSLKPNEIYFTTSNPHSS